METKYDVFISYSRKDYIDENTKVVIPDNPVSKIMKAFDDAGITYWIDKKGIYHGDEFSGVIADAIEASSVFVFVSSEYSNNSPWTTGEIATAQEAKKKIIPVRIDFSRYHKSLRVRLNALDYIDFTSNLEENTQSLIVAIKAYLTQIKEEEERKKEEERRKRELERQKAEEAKRKQEEEAKRKQEEQQKLIDGIRGDCTILNNKETQLEIDRKNLLIRAKAVEAQEQRKELMYFIESSCPIAKKYEEQLFLANEQIAEKEEQLLFANNQIAKEKEKIGLECQQFEEEKKNYRHKYQQLEKESSKLNNQIAEEKKQKAQLSQNLTTIKEELDTTKQTFMTLTQEKEVFSRLYEEEKEKLSLAKKQIEKEKTEKDLLSQSLTEIQKELKEAKIQIEKKEKQKKLLSIDLTNIQRELEAAKKQAQHNPEKTTIKPNNKKFQILLAMSLLLGLILGFISTSFIHSAFSSDEELVTDTLASTQPITPIENIEPPQPKKVVKEVIVSPQLNSYTYTGWVNSEGVPDGEGEAVFANGDTFVGTFSNGELKKGKYTWVEDESYFEGAFKNNEPDEQAGAYYNKNGKKL